MKRFAAAALAVFALSAPASAATLYVGHGIDGRDLGLPSQDLPVDICLVSGPAALGRTYPVKLFPNVIFTNFAKIPIDLPAGQYGVEVQLASSGNCTGTVAISSTFPINLGETSTAFAHLDEFGNPTLTKFVNDVRPLADGQTRLFARHAAAFGDVNVYLRKGRSSVVIRKLENPEQEGADLRAGSWYVAIYPAGSWSKPAFHATLPLEEGTAYFAYAVGTPSKDSFTVLVQEIDLK